MKTPPSDERLLVGAKTVCEMLSISRSQVYAMTSTGKLPQPVKVGGRTLWRRRELEAWVEAGCKPVGAK
jgi:excisionase family DNA binding protein